jgi:hypothetical protein
MAITCDISKNGMTTSDAYARLSSLDVVRDDFGRRVATWVASFKREQERTLNLHMIGVEHANMVGEKPSLDDYVASRLEAVEPIVSWHPFASGQIVVESVSTAEAECYAALKASEGVSNAVDVFEPGQN